MIDIPVTFDVPKVPKEPKELTIEITESAWERIKELQEDNDGILRIAVKAGGCAGYQYSFQFDTDVDWTVENDQDYVIRGDGAGLVIDKYSATLINGSTVDFVKDLMGSQFTINIPNATVTCGCGASFGC